MSYSVVSRCLGVLLLSAAALKLHGLAIDPVGRSGLFSAPEWQVAVVEMEILLALWLISGNRPIGSWITSILAFGSFAVASSYQGWIGYASCGCFGNVEVNPWLTFGLDVAVIAALIAGRPDLQQLSASPRSSLATALLPLGAGIGGTATMLALLVGIAHLSFGSSQAALAYLRGERLSVSPRLLDMGAGHAGETCGAAIELRNWTDKSIRVYGGTSDCSCVATDDLPLTIPPGGCRSLRVKMRLPSADGIFNRTASLMTDDVKTGILMFRLTGQISKLKDEANTAQGNGP